MKKACKDAIERIYPYLDGEATFYRKTRVRLHLRKCRGCGDAFSFEQRLKAVIRERSREDVPPEVIDRLRSYLNEQSPGSVTD